MTNKYEVSEAIKLINKSFYSYQNKFDTYELEKIFKSKLQILKDLNYFESQHKQKTLTETYRDTFIPGLEIIEEGKEMSSTLCFFARVSQSQNMSFQYTKNMKIFTQIFYIEEEINKLEAQNNINNRTISIFHGLAYLMNI